MHLEYLTEFWAAREGEEEILSCELAIVAGEWWKSKRLAAPLARFEWKSREKQASGAAAKSRSRRDRWSRSFRRACRWLRTCRGRFAIRDHRGRLASWRGRLRG